MEFRIIYFNRIKKYNVLMKFDLILNKQALHIAVEKGNLEVVKLLLRRRDIEVNTKAILDNIMFSYHSKLILSIQF